MNINPVLTVRQIKDDTWPHLDFNNDTWRDIPAQTLVHHMGIAPEHRPLTQFKIACDSEAVRVIFKVEDRYVKAVAKGYQGPVFKDSCVEFFFSPNAHVSSGYFNLEVNCCGTALFEFHPPHGGNLIKIPESAFRKISIAHQLEGPIDPEIETPLTWSVAFRLPFEILRPYCPVTIPGPGASWRANFYKCGDKTSHPHWLTWAHVDFPAPRFHLPEFFGVLSF